MVTGLLFILVEGENSGVVGLSLVLLLGGESEVFELVGLNAGAEGLSLVPGGDASGDLGLMSSVVAGFGMFSILPCFPSIGEARLAAAAELALVPLPCSAVASSN